MARGSIVALLLGGTGVSHALLPDIFHQYSASASERTRFDWTGIATSEDLHYTPCYHDFECGKISIPLDWNNASSPHNISIAVIRLPAKVPETHPDFGGSIFTNPGGPGGSGVQQAYQLAHRLQKLLEGPRHYEILSFDPRGIFRSKPNAYCFRSAVESEIWSEQKQAAGSLDSGDYALKYNWAAEKAHGELCAETENGKFDDGENLRRHMSTAYVARDVLEILKRVEERKKRLYKRDSQVPMNMPLQEIETPKLQYIGTSYGTFLGQTFAAMYPENVKRMILDANLDADNWMSRYEASIDDSAQIREYFFEACFAGSSDCALYREYDKSPADIKARYDDLVEALNESPSYVTGNGRATPITRADLQQGFFTASYQPIYFFSKFARFANDLITDRNTGPPFWQLPVPGRNSFSDELLINAYQGGEPGPAVHCSDGPYLADEGLAGYRAYLSNLTTRFGGWAGAIQANYKLACWTWPKELRTQWRFEGPFNASVPILFLNNRLDPATPIRSARKMSALFNGSVVLEQDSSGHGALWPAGDCIWRYTKQYMDTGKLPPPNTVCKPLCRPFADDACRGSIESFHLA